MTAKGDTLKPCIKVVASPLRHKKKKCSIEANYPLISRNLKHPGGFRKLLLKCHQMEFEVSTLKRRFMASKDNQKKMKKYMQEQRDKTYDIISTVAQVLEQKENQIQELHTKKESELSKLSQELLFLQSNMLKEKSRLESIISELSTKVSSQDNEIKMLKKQLHQQRSHNNTTPTINLRNDSPTSDLDTHSPSSEESSPKSTLYNKTTENSKISNLRASFLSNTINGGIENISSSLQIKPCISSGKPPIPSRVGVNRKINLRLKDKKVISVKDEGFFSSYEESSSYGGFNPKSTPHPATKRTMSFQHEPRVKSISNFGALEELNVTSTQLHGQQNEKTPTTIIRYLDYL
ncbi:uncharacterized protein [Lepeophtheirus salmonis]|uniref:uncharacterized protein isoform X1 n=2 Tax=Lepeophtheirus salmonis TaxID=72036 RepID=UPI001AE478D0|nr:uncharacterized protein LOC121126118 isoform X1 [Lepeophtheirus salmonis]XP_040577357.1 uncharacterized protein LOC121126118 isoform X1 [Lepeophtheirus salmonis]XP_040577358.1 uncharacterized protein LOC121126118 isoform X1 [Lepeophtheirus salmonis]